MYPFLTYKMEMIFLVVKVLLASLCKEHEISLACHNTQLC